MSILLFLWLIIFTILLNFKFIAFFCHINYLIEIMLFSLNEWFSLGVFIIHSWLNIFNLNIIFCFDIILSIIIDTNIIINIVVEIAPVDDREFQNIIWSENIKYRRGIPFRPKKCWGKKVRLIEINRLIKLIFNILFFNMLFVNIGNQKIILEKIENTTPIDNT